MNIVNRSISKGGKTTPRFNAQRLLVVAVAAAVIAPAGHAAEPSKVNQQTVAKWLKSYYEKMDLATRGGRAIHLQAEGLDTAAGATCRQPPRKVSSQKRREIEHSAAYQRVDTRCTQFDPQTMKKAMAMGLVEEHKPSPSVFNFTLTDAGKQHVKALGNGRFEIAVAATSLEHVLNVKQAVNQYGVPVVDVTYTTTPQALDWAKSYVGQDKTIDIGNTDATKHVAQFWQTDNGWQMFYSYKS